MCLEVTSTIAFLPFSNCLISLHTVGHGQVDVPNRIVLAVPIDLRSVDWSVTIPKDVGSHNRHATSRKYKLCRTIPHRVEYLVDLSSIWSLSGFLCKIQIRSVPRSDVSFYKPLKSLRRHQISTPRPHVWSTQWRWRPIPSSPPLRRHPRQWPEPPDLP